MRDASHVGMRPIVVVAAASLFTIALARPLFAQCTSNASSCVSCHETQGMRSVLNDGRAWHADHGFGDLCIACHGGAPRAVDAASAHVGLVSPLEDPARTCGGCHADALAKAERYRAVVPAPSASPSVAIASAPPPAGPASPSSPSRAPIDRVLAAIAGLLALVIAVVLARDRGLLARARPLAALRAKLWSPYAAGALLGVVVALSESFLGRPIAASGAFDRLGAYVGRALFPKSPYWAYEMQPAITWQVWLVVGLLLGAFVAARLSGEARARWLPDDAWVPRYGTSRAKRLVVAFVGAVLVQVGAGIAGGCTSGLAISGGALLAPAAFLFMMGMFAGGIPAAWLASRRGAARRERRS